MVATTAPEVFTDWKRQSAELHIARLFQVEIQDHCRKIDRFVVFLHVLYQALANVCMCSRAPRGCRGTLWGVCSLKDFT